MGISGGNAFQEVGTTRTRKLRQKFQAKTHIYFFFYKRFCLFETQRESICFGGEGRGRERSRFFTEQGA